jgi:O-antigen ligase
MKKINLFPKTNVKEIRIGNIIFLVAIACLLIFGSAISFLTKPQALFCLWVIVVLLVFGISFKLTGIIKQYRFAKREIANGRPIEIGC